MVSRSDKGMIQYFCFNSKGEAIGYKSDHGLARAREYVDGNGGWIEDVDGHVIYGKKPRGTINLTPTWESLLTALLYGYENSSDKGRAAAHDELKRMAQAADAWNEHCRSTGDT